MRVTLAYPWRGREVATSTVSHCTHCSLMGFRGIYESLDTYGHMYSSHKLRTQEKNRIRMLKCIQIDSFEAVPPVVFERMALSCDHHGSDAATWTTWYCKRFRDTTRRDRVHGRSHTSITAFISASCACQQRSNSVGSGEIQSVSGTFPVPIGGPRLIAGNTPVWSHLQIRVFSLIKSFHRRVSYS